MSTESPYREAVGLIRVDGVLDPDESSLPAARYDATMATILGAGGEG